MSMITFICWYLGNICIALICFPEYDIINFEINLKKVKTKTEIP